MIEIFIGFLLTLGLIAWFSVEDKEEKVPLVCGWCGEKTNNYLKSYHDRTLINLGVCGKKECYDAIYNGRLQDYLPDGTLKKEQE